jgi:hypothetical protein
MDFLLKLFFGLLLMAAGVGLLKYRKIIHDWTGNFVWAERYLGSGGTVAFLSLIGMLLIGIGVAYPFGVLDSLTDRNI